MLKFWDLVHREIPQAQQWNVAEARLESDQYYQTSFQILFSPPGSTPGCVYFIPIYHVGFLVFIQTQLLPKQDRKLSDLTQLEKKEAQVKLCWIVPRVTAERWRKVLSEAAWGSTQEQLMLQQLQQFQAYLWAQAFFILLAFSFYLHLPKCL